MTMAYLSTIANHPWTLARQIFHVDREEIGYLRFTLESYDGMISISTLDPYAALIEVAMSPGCEGMVLELLESLRRKEGLNIKRVYAEGIT